MSDALWIVGAGYTGGRLRERAEGDPRFTEVRAWRSADWNLDESRPPPSGHPTCVVYLVPPRNTGEHDPRLGQALDALLQPGHHLRRWVQVSTTGVYGDAAGATVDEDTPPAPATPRARRRLAGEQLLRERCAVAGVEWVILRVPGIYGPGRLPLERLRRGDPLPASASRRPGNRIHVDDLVTALLLAASHPAAANTVFNVGDGDPTSQVEFQHRVAELAGLPPPPLLPDNDAAAVLSAEAWSFLAESRRVDTRRLRERLGFMPRYGDCVAGIRASLI